MAGTTRWSRPKPSSRSAKELTEAGCDWQIHAYGHTGHGFTNPKAAELQIHGVFYDAGGGAPRSFAALYAFLGELFG